MLVFLTQDHLHDSRYSNAGGILIRRIPGESSIQNTVSTRSVMLKKPRKDWDLDTNRISSFRTGYTSTSSTISSSDTLCQQPTMHPTRPLTLTTMSPTAMWPMRMHAERLLRKVRNIREIPFLDCQGSWAQAPDDRVPFRVQGVVEQARAWRGDRKPVLHTSRAQGIREAASAAWGWM